jgi:hypothetical protein
VPPHRHHFALEDDQDHGDFLLTYHKLDFPKFDRSCDPLPWLNRCEHYFRVRRTSDHKRVSYASFHLLDDTQLWYHHLELNNRVPPWPDFTRLINARFGPPMTDTPLGALALLCRTGSVDEFYSKFMALSCRDLTLNEGQQIKLFMTGLGKLLCTDVALKQPRSLDAAVMLARAYEQRLGVVAVPSRTARRASKPWSTPTPVTSWTDNAPPSTSTKKFSPAEIVDRREKGSASSATNILFRATAMTTSDCSPSR